MFVISSRGGAARRLTFDRQITEGFAWTNDSRDLVLASYRNGGPGLWRIAAKGGTPQQIASMAHHPAFPAIAPRGNRLAFSESVTDSNIWQYERPGPVAGSAAGSAAVSAPAFFATPKCLICSTAEDDSPRFSPDGRKIVFVSTRTGSNEIWVADSDGSYLTQLTSLGGVGNGSPRWSPDGNWIVFDSLVKGSPDVFVVSAQGGSPHQVTTEPAMDIEPSWSHDGRWIYFTSDRGGQDRIWKIPFHGGSAQQVTRGNAEEAIESPDGKRLYYFRAATGDGIWTVPVDGGREEVIPELSDVKATRAWTVRDKGIYFSGDGSGGKRQVRFFDFATRGVTTVLTPDRAPLWNSPGLDISPDGRRLLYTQSDQKVEGLMMLENFR